MTIDFTPAQQAKLDEWDKDWQEHRRGGSKREDRAGRTETISCEGKQAFDQRRHANRAAKRKRGRHVYRCVHCRKWHVGTSLIPKYERGGG